MRDTMTVAGWVGGAMLLSVSLMVLCQHAEGERTRAALRVAQAQVDNRIRTLDARLTDVQADVNRKKLASVTNPPLDPRHLAKAARDLDRLIGTPPAAPPPLAAAGRGPAAPAPAPATVTSSTRSPEAAAGEFVRVCAGGKFFHRPGCKRVQKRTMPIARADAESQGWKPCPTCKP